MKTRARGFTLIEAVIVIAILGFLAALGMPQMAAWLQGANVKSAAEFYTEGLRLARVEAVRRNAASRFRINTPDANGWSVDWCQPTTTIPCNSGSGAWNNVNAQSGSAFGNVTLTVCPGGAADVIYTAVGWVNMLGAAPVSALRIDPPNVTAVKSAQVEINLSGIVSNCDPSIANVADSRHCQVTCP